MRHNAISAISAHCAANELLDVQIMEPIWKPSKRKIPGSEVFGPTSGSTLRSGHHNLAPTSCGIVAVLMEAIAMMALQVVAGNPAFSRV